MKNILYRYGVLIICLFFSSIVFNLFLYPIKLVTGGMNGIAIIVNHLIKASPSIVIFIGSSICLLLSTILLSKEQTIASLLATFIYPFFVSITSVIRGYFNGRQNFSITAKSQSLEQIFKTVLTILIVEIVAYVTSTSTEMMAAGANVATTLATFSSFAYLFMYYRLRRKEIGNMPLFLISLQLFFSV